MRYARELGGAAFMIGLGVAAGLLWPLHADRELPVVEATGSTSTHEGTGTSSGAPVSPTILRSRQVVRDPTAPSYDATRLVRADNMTPREVFELEPRVESFAVAREVDLGGALRDAIASLDEVGDLDLTVECHTATCVAQVSVEAVDAERLSLQLTLFPFAEMVQPGIAVDPENPDRKLLTFSVAYTPSFLERDAYLRWYEDALWTKGLAIEQGMPGLIDPTADEGS